MNISSTPFIRNDYWPDYNDINQLNQRINEVENELSLTNIRLSTDIENVSNNLNSYADNQANTTIANNIIVNNINANYAVGKFVNFGNANFNNAYVENLTVNKPVFDITLNTPHIENVTSLGGNIYDANLFNVNITGGDVAFNNVSIDDLNAANATISNVNILNGDVNLNSAVIGDLTVTNASISNVDILDGNVNLNKAVISEVNASKVLVSNINILDGNAVLNKVNISDLNASNATVSNLFVNTQTEPVTSSAVLGYDSEGRVIPVHASFDVGFPEDANYLYTDHAGTAFAGTAATEVSTVNNLITAQAVQNGFNDINANVQNGFNDVNNVFNDINANVQNGFNDINANSSNKYNDLLNMINALVPGGIGLNLQLNYINSTSPVNYQNVEHVIITAGQIGNVWCDTTDKLGTQYYDWNATTNTLTFSSLTGIVTFNTNMMNTFQNCANLNQNIQIPNSVTTMIGTFYGCASLNQNIQIPNSVAVISATVGGKGIFRGCTSLNQNILIPNSVSAIDYAFLDCTSLNQNILIPNSVSAIDYAFYGCTSLNQNILIPNSVRFMDYAFYDCTSLNQNIYLYSDIIDIIYGMPHISNTFVGCSLLADKYIHIRSSIPMDTSNDIYNGLVNNYTGVNWTGRVINDLEEPTQWPPV